MSVSKLLINAGFNPDGVIATPRMTQRGEQDVNLISPKNIRLAEEGSFYVACNPTISTGVALQGNTTTAWVATTPSILIVNNDAVGGKCIYLDYARLLVTAAGAGLAQLQSAVLIDSINRYSSGGTAIAVAGPTNTGVNTVSIAKLYYGATATAASSNVRVVGRAALRGAIPVVNDQYTLVFGGDASVNAHGTDGTTTIMNKAVNFAPLVICPQHSALIYLWAGSMSTSPSTEFEIAWAER